MYGRILVALLALALLYLGGSTIQSNDLVINDIIAGDQEALRVGLCSGLGWLLMAAGVIVGWRALTK